MADDASRAPNDALQLQPELCQPFPASRRIFVDGGQGVRVPMREIACSPTRSEQGLIDNPPITVYDTAGPYTDPDAHIDLARGLEPLRAQWIAARGDSEQLSGPSSLYGRIRAGDEATAGLRFPAPRAPTSA